MKIEITYIHGARGTGKSTLARALASEMGDYCIHELPDSNLPRTFGAHRKVIVTSTEPPKPKDRQRIARVIEIK